MSRRKRFAFQLDEERLAAVWPVSSSCISKMAKVPSREGSVAGMVLSVYLLRRKASSWYRKLTPESS
jgi:hypothetical protein